MVCAVTMRSVPTYSPKAANAANADSGGSGGSGGGGHGGSGGHGGGRGAAGRAWADARVAGGVPADPVVLNIT